MTRMLHAQSLDVECDKHLHAISTIATMCYQQQTGNRHRLYRLFDSW